MAVQGTYITNDNRQMVDFSYEDYRADKRKELSPSMQMTVTQPEDSYGQAIRTTGGENR